MAEQLGGCHLDQMKTASKQLSGWPGVQGAEVIDECDGLDTPEVSFSVSDLPALRQKLTQECTERKAPFEGDTWFICTLGDREGSLTIEGAAGSFSFN